MFIVDTFNTYVKDFFRCMYTFSIYYDTITIGGVFMSLCENIKKYRKLKGLTQKELGLIIDKKEITIRKYESGNISLSVEMLNKIATALGVTINDLVENDKIELKINSTFEDAFNQFITDKRYLLDAKTYDSIEDYNNDLKILYKNIIDSIEFHTFKLKNK